MKIHILTAVWMRPEITRICFEGIKRLGLQATAVISEESAITLCEEYGINWVMSANKPLGGKWNTGMKQALNHEWDYIMILGSDDIVSNSLIDLYKPYLGKYYMIGVDSCYFYHKGEIKKHYSGRMSIGAGRILHRSLVEDCFPLWQSINKGLDGSCLIRIREKMYDEHVIKLKDAVILDIKSEVNINSFEKLEGDIVSNDLLQVFSDRERQLLNELIY